MNTGKFNVYRSNLITPLTILILSAASRKNMWFCYRCLRWINYINTLNWKKKTNPSKWRPIHRKRHRVVKIICSNSWLTNWEHTPSVKTILWKRLVFAYYEMSLCIFNLAEGHYMWKMAARSFQNKGMCIPNAISVICTPLKAHKSLQTPYNFLI